VALASSWDPQLVWDVGVGLAREARALGVDVVLGPGLEIALRLQHPGTTGCGSAPTSTTAACGRSLIFPLISVTQFPGFPISTEEAEEPFAK
jgi:beta-glucosidase-like glycosyl hydrolase